ncbi:MAG: 1-deoxy-D-xylulose-5-phosphate synthase [Clostridia bacterium]|nr:1-deoxy-D-xylulose-5-phosphate synthase [Clostridia bacterium]
MTDFTVNYDEIEKNLNHLSKQETDYLCSDIRRILIDTISKNGGHLASNLGVVELTVALHKSFDFNHDVIIYDVGHQSYTHKILTGRKSSFDTIRKFNGLSGFPKITESKYDFFNTGHSSTSISAALGYARAAKINHEDKYSIAVIGDGALTGGMALEALNDTGLTDEKIIVILNDNEMSITKNMGGFARHLANIRAKKIYFNTNIRAKKIIARIPLVGKHINKFLHKIKMMMKYFFTQGIFFEELGFTYFGPVDGHDVTSLCEMFEDAKKINGPVLVHVVTIKGKGYDKAQENPQDYHGVGQFNIDEGIISKNNRTFSKVFGEYIAELAETDGKINIICPATAIGNGLTKFYDTYKDRFFDVGIAEQHAVTLAGGLALGQTKPVVAIYSTFLQRAYDQILHDICLMNLPVLFCIDRAGLVGEDGETHQGIYDTAFLNHFPNMTVFAPSRESDLKEAINQSLYQINSPAAVRYSKGECIQYEILEQKDELGPCYVVKGNDVVLFSYNSTLQQLIDAEKLLKNHGISASVIDIRKLKPLDTEYLKQIIARHKIALFVEEVIYEGSVYCSFINIKGVYGINLDGKPCPHGSYEELLKAYHMDSVSLTDYVLEIMHGETR